MKTKYLLAVAIALAVVISAYMLSVGIRHFRGGDPEVKVTGLSERNITSDLITLPIKVSSQAMDQVEAYNGLQESRRKVLAFLVSKGVAGGELTQSSTSVIRDEDKRYNENTMNYETVVFRGYILSFTITIRSNRVDQVEAISSNISELLGQGVALEVQPASYYYTKFGALKAEMLREAAKDAHDRAKIVAEGAKASLGKLRGASMGVFQVVGRNINEDFSWGGSFNTTHKEKTASVTIKAIYRLD